MPQDVHPIEVADLERRLPPEPALGPAITMAADERLVVLDDDPTGNQTVHDVPLLARFDEGSLREILADHPTVFLLTNSRALEEQVAVALFREIGTTLRRLAEELGLRLRIASRSDSTLRGHFPAEVVALQETVGAAGCLLAPCFVEGGRLTFDDVHWVREGDQLIPVGQTPYSEDASFGFTSSHLPSWVEEKSAGAIPAQTVRSVSIQDLRVEGPERVAGILRDVGDGVVVANATSYADLRVLVHGLATAEAAGSSFVYRCGASFVRERAGIGPRALLDSSELDAPPSGLQGGLVVCGSHVPNTTAQLERLLELEATRGIELDVKALLTDQGERDAIVAEISRRAVEEMARGRHAVVFTSRTVVTAEGWTPLQIANQASRALIDVVRGLGEQPPFLVSKGGITSHDIATVALGMRRGTVLGQISPGVPVWRIEDGPAEGTAYVVFPGNVGNRDTLYEVVARLAGRDDPGPTPPGVD